MIQKLTAGGENYMEIKRIEDDPYIAHCKDDLQEIQSVSTHNQETAQLAQSYCTMKELTAISYLAAVLHDCGKYSDRFQEYIRQEEASLFRRGEVNHSTAGGILMEELAPKTSLSEIIQIVKERIEGGANEKAALIFR